MRVLTRAETLAPCRLGHVVTCSLLLTGALTAPARLESQQAESPRFLEPPVTFLQQAPRIDGKLDEGLDLPVREFPEVRKEGPDNPTVPASYRLAYGTDFFYVQVEAEADSLIFRDRAYQNGDGFAMVIAIPKPNDEPTDEFYVLACSAVEEPRLEWTRRIFWYYNVTTIFVPTSDEAKLEFHEGDGKISFELYLPWKDVHPSHPWISEGIGFNLRFAKAMENGSRNFYQVFPGTIGAENSNRPYIRLTFEEPAVSDGVSQTFVQLQRRNLRAGDTLYATAATLSAAPITEELAVYVRTAEGTAVAGTRPRHSLDAGLSLSELALPTSGLPPGGYRVGWSSRANDSRGEGPLSVLPEIDAAGLRDRLAEVRDKISPGSLTTLEFRVEESLADLADVKPYEAPGGHRVRLARTLELLDRAVAGEDAILESREFVRRAYRSAIDSTLQPYVVWVPPDYDPGRRYPLLVFLHGSASDETDIVGFRRSIPEGFIALGPKGRGPSNAWSWDHAQEDIAESIDAVRENYSIDDERIILSGFSMGGYGVYRTYYETPEKFRGLIVMSGAPNIANRYSGSDDHPNFEEERYLKAFEGVPIFIFHGGRDRNVPIEPTSALVEKLRAVGALVEFHVEDEKGHEGPSSETVDLIHEWLRQVIDDVSSF